MVKSSQRSLALNKVPVTVIIAVTQLQSIVILCKFYLLEIVVGGGGGCGVGGGGGVVVTKVLLVYCCVVVLLYFKERFIYKKMYVYIFYI